MAPPEQASQGSSAIYFMEGATVSRQMRASEFGAYLDGYVGLSDLADTDVRAALVVLNNELLVEALVFFRIYFDAEGRADDQWNIPIEELAKQGAKGPDLGAGPIRLVCRSLCPDQRFVAGMWDPDMAPGSNSFQAIRKAVAANALKFQRPSPAPSTTPADIPLLIADPDPDTDSDLDSKQGAERGRLAQTIREQRLRIKTMRSVHRDALADQQRDCREELQVQRNNFSELQQKYEHQGQERARLEQRLAERDQQHRDLQTLLDSTQNQLAEAKEQFERKLGAEAAMASEHLERKQQECAELDAQLQALRHENDELQHRQPSEAALMRHLREHPVYLVAFHPGSGHLTLSYDDIGAYLSNPLGYAARKCDLSETAYREWLEHYEKPVCQSQTAGDQVCGLPVMRISRPADYKAGVDDRCDDHRALSDAVLANDQALQTSD